MDQFLALMQSVFVPVAICVVLPGFIVWVVFRAAINTDNKKAEVLIKAIEANNGMDAEKLAEALTKKKNGKTPEERLFKLLKMGWVFTLSGIAFGIAALIQTLVCTMPAADAFPCILIGLIFFAIGIALLIVWRITCKQA